MKLPNGDETSHYELLQDLAFGKIPEALARSIVWNNVSGPWFNNALPGFGRDMDQLFVSTEGHGLEAIGEFWRVTRPIACHNAPNSFATIADDVARNGFAVVPDAISSDAVQALLSEMSHSLLTNSHTGQSFSPNRESSPWQGEGLSGNYRSLLSDLVLNPHNSPILNLLFSDLIIQVAQAYFRTPIYVNDLVLFFTNPSKEKKLSAEEKSAYSQMWHYDLSQLRWLNFFFYLNTVDEDNGAHQCVAMSHKRFVPPDSKADWDSTSQGRLSDSYVDRHYGVDSVKTHCGGAGTLIVEDTRCLHRATPVRSGKRIMLQVNVSISNMSTWSDSTHSPTVKGDPSLVQEMMNAGCANPTIGLDSYLTKLIGDLRPLHESVLRQFRGSKISDRCMSILRRTTGLA